MLLAYQLSTKPEQGIVPSYKDGELEKSHSAHLPAMESLLWSLFATVNLEIKRKDVNQSPFTFLLVYSYVYHKCLASSSNRSV